MLERSQCPGFASERRGQRIRPGGLDRDLPIEQMVVGFENLPHPTPAKELDDLIDASEKLTGGEFLRFVAGLWGTDPREAEERGDRLLRLFNLDRWKDELVESYSHGMRQKLLITSALCHHPELVIVDEPMVGLDPRSARILKDLLRAFVEAGGTVFLSTHTLEVAEALCDRIAIIHQGRIIAQGTMEELRRQSDSGDAHLEEIFLKVTGGDDMAAVVASLRDALEMQ